MFNLHLTERRREALWDTLLSSHRIKVVVHLHDSDENPVGDLDFHFGTSHVVEGAVQVDATQDVSRSLSLTFLDPFRRFRWSPDHTSHGTLYSGDFISVRYGVMVEHDNLSLGGGTKVSPKTVLGMQPVTKRKRKHWVEIPVFWGPLTGYEMNGALVTVEAQGKESLALEPHFANQGFTLNKHTRIDDAMEKVMDRIGERRYRIPDLPYRLHADRAVHPRSEPWKVIQGGEQDAKGHAVAGLIHRTGKHPHQAFFDAEGRLKVRRLNKTDPVFRFDTDSLLSWPDVTYDSLSFFNTVSVTGAKPQGKGKKAAKAQVSLPKHHPLSPWSDQMMRNGKPRYLTLYVDAENLKTDRECRQRAVHLLNHHSQIGVSTSFDALPIPLLEENDLVRVVTDDFALTHTLKTFTIPLTDESMSIGYNKRLKVGAHRKVPGSGGAAGPSGGGGHGAGQGGTGHGGSHKQHA